MNFALWALFGAISVLNVAAMAIDIAINLNEIGKQLHRIAFWTEDYYEDKREGKA